MQTLRHMLPNALTIANLASGFIAIVLFFQASFLAAAVWMALAVFFDGVDGKLATLLDAKSAIGTELDALSDGVSFALLPGFALYLYFQRAPEPSFLWWAAAWSAGIGYALAGIMREVRYLTTQTARTRGEGFIGLPIAPPAGLIVALTALAGLYPAALHRGLWPFTMYALTVVCATLMTLSTINYGRWRSAAIAAQLALALIVAAIAYLMLGRLDATFIIFWATFCAIYVTSHPLLDAVRLIRPRLSTA